MDVIKPPNVFYLDSSPVVFLAGSIEQDTAVRWQDAICEELTSYKGVILNPRRDMWDASWKQDMQNKEFYRQVNWELRGLKYADIVAFYFDPTTKSPITMLELGLCATNHKQKKVVCCPEGFWRKGNVDITCEFYGVNMVSSFQQLVDYLKRNVSSTL